MQLPTWKVERPGGDGFQKTVAENLVPVVSKPVTMKSEQENTITGYDEHHNLSSNSVNSENSGVETGYDEIGARKTP